VRTVGEGPVLDGVDLTDLDAFADGFPHDVFARHRREAPVFWHEPTEHTPDGEGFWSVATYAEALEVIRDPVTFSSERGGSRQHGGTMLQDMPVAGVMLNMMDDPRHNRIRRLVSGGLTPRTLRRLEDDLRRRSVVLLEAAGDEGEVDFLEAVAAELPMQAICILLGVPEEDRHLLFECVEHIFDVRRDRDPAAMGAAMHRMSAYGKNLVASKRAAAPADDMLSIVVHASLEDEEPPQLTDGELDGFFTLLFAAGADTTRNAIAGGLLALVERPEQLAALRAEPSLLPTAIEEILRWTTPSPSKRRTATVDTEFAGHRIRAGDKVLYWEASANRDEAVFRDGMVFDIRREPNPHLAFGHGVHFCLGAGLARLEMRVLFEQVLPRFGSIELAGPVEWTRSNRHTGLRHLPLRLAR
jgi:cytochrome P450